MTTPDNKQQPLWSDAGRTASGPVECLGMTFASDEARREHFLEQLRAGLDDLRANLAGLPFTTVDAAVARMQAVTRWPLGDDERLRAMAEAMRDAEPGKDLLQRWKDLVGFPIGEDEDILRLSDPPYYTACPNPFLADFIKAYGRPYNSNEPYHREPFAADVSEGKNDPIYNAHSYHTKVPHKAIMRYILHYTNPGELVMDGFCGTGMTGVAARLCGNRSEIESIGYHVDSNELISNQDGNTISRLGARHAILSDLSTGATFIAGNYCSPSDMSGFETFINKLLDSVESEYGLLFRSGLASSESSTLEYSVWSDVFTCPNCNFEICYWDATVNTKEWSLINNPICPSCSTEISRRELDRIWENTFDPVLNIPVIRAKKVRVWDVWSRGNIRNEGSVPPDLRNSLGNLADVDFYRNWIPRDIIPKGDKTSDPFSSGIRYVHQYWSLRTLAVISRVMELGAGTPFQNLVWFLVTSSLDRLSLRNGYRPQHKKNKSRELGGPLPGNLYIPVFSVELNPTRFLRSRAPVLRSLSRLKQGNRGCIITAQSSTRMDIPANSLDYIFVDPPFGGNLMYSELSFALESWLRVRTNNKQEAIINKVQEKTEDHYRILMFRCFSEMHRVLKPGKWMTVEFHNSRNSIWNTIQEALSRAGFVVADVRTLNRNLGSLNQIISANAVKQDLIISAYKPPADLESKFRIEAGLPEGAWDFVRSHLRQLPIGAMNEGTLESLAERMGYMLYDRMVGFHIQRGVTVPLSAAEFYAGLEQRFAKRQDAAGNVMYFLPEQVAEYDKKRMTAKEVLQLELIITGEKSAIEWLRQQLTRKPQTFQDLHPQFMREIGGWQKFEQPLELSDLLRQNFLPCDSTRSIPPQIVAWMRQSADLRQIVSDELTAGRAVEDENGLTTQSPRLLAAAKDRWYVADPNRAQDLERLRERALLDEFAEYVAFKGRKLKVFRLEAVRAGFKRAWQSRSDEGYRTIVAVADKIPEDVLYEDQTLLTFYDNARTRLGDVS